MRVERVGVDKVKDRLAALKQKEEAKKTAVRPSSVVCSWLSGVTWQATGVCVCCCLLVG